MSVHGSEFAASGTSGAHSILIPKMFFIRRDGPTDGIGLVAAQSWVANLVVPLRALESPLTDYAGAVLYSW